MITRAKNVIFFYLTLTLVLTGILHPGITPGERSALIALYNSTSGDNWTNNHGWKTQPLHTDGFALPGTEDNWYGVTCDEGNTTVLGISLHNNNLKGVFPDQLASLTHLVHLDLSSNRLEGRIPPELGGLMNLSVLNLGWNRLRGPIPPELGSLSNLTVLDLHQNRLMDGIPPELHALTNLTVIDLEYNQLTGAIPVELAELSNLTSLNLGFNVLTGEIPVELGKLSNLENFDLRFNQLTGTIPPQLGQLTDLTSLHLDWNNLSGRIPAELGDLVNLTVLDLDGNQLTGPIPPELGRLTNLLFLDLDKNRLQGAIPPELGGLTNLVTLDFGENELTGLIPPEMGALKMLTHFEMNWNRLAGVIPPELGNLENLIILRLRENQLTGSIPAELGQLEKLTTLNFDSNLLSGPIPPELGRLENLTSLLLGENRLTGSIPAELGRLENLISLLLPENQLTGTIPGELGGITNLKSLHLGSNRLTGHIPPGLRRLANLEHLYINSNKLTGAIPPELEQLKKLRYLDLSENGLSGRIPPELGRLSALISLSLKGNRLGGAVPPELQNLENLYVYHLDLRWNALYTDDESLTAFLNEKHSFPPWNDTQTTAPKGVTARVTSDSSIMVRWSPIEYKLSRGGYSVFHSSKTGGPYKFVGSTRSKFSDRLEVTGLEANTDYYFVVKTHTEPHEENFNRLQSEYSAEVFGRIEPGVHLISGHIVTSDGHGLEGVTLVFSPDNVFRITDAEGYYRYTVNLGWSGTVEPAKIGYRFEPGNISFENVISSHTGTNFLAVPIMLEISGRVTAADRGLPGIPLTAYSDGGETQTVTTDNDGYYKHLVPYGWAGRVAPSKGHLLFYPTHNDYPLPGVTGIMNHEDYRAAIAIDLQASRGTDSALIIKREYGRIEVNVTTLGNAHENIRKFVIYRKEANGNYLVNKEFTLQNLESGAGFTYEDKYLDKETVYTYIVKAHDKEDRGIGESKEVTVE